jgi:hypothetical protein
MYSNCRLILCLISLIVKTLSQNSVEARNTLKDLIGVIEGIVDGIKTGENLQID